MRMLAGTGDRADLVGRIHRMVPWIVRNPGVSVLEARRTFELVVCVNLGVFGSTYVDLRRRFAMSCVRRERAAYQCDSSAALRPREVLMAASCGISVFSSGFALARPDSSR
jgi:hypothetical protein